MDRFARDSATRIAVIAILVSVLALSFGDAVIKSISISFPLWQLYVLRSAIALPVLVALMHGRFPRIKALRWVVLRSLLLAIMWVAYYAALPHLSLSVAAAGYYTLPLFITIFAGLFTREKVGITAWLAIGLGFAGVWVILQPDAAGFNAYALLPVFAAVLYALAMVLTRTKCRNEHPMMLSLALNITFVVVGLVATFALMLVEPVSQNTFLTGSWVRLGLREVIALAVLAVAMLIGSIFAAKAYQLGAPSTVASFDYAYLAFSVLWGVLFFTDIPDGVTLLGIGMIATAGLIAVRKP